MTDEQSLQELKCRQRELQRPIQYYKSQLKPLEDEFCEVTMQKLVLEEKLAKVTFLPYRSKSMSKAKPQTKLISQFKVLSPRRKRELLDALEGELKQMER